MKDLKKLVRANIWDMAPYSSARNEFHGDASVFLDANENPWNLPYNRYPDPMQWKLKERMAEQKGISPNSIFLGNGSDEAIDVVIRTFCNPGVDDITTITPSYGMYEVAADVNGVKCNKVQLDKDFALNADALLQVADEWTKVIYLCSPNNPTGNTLNREELYKIINTFEGIVVIDEAYIDFSSSPSFLTELADFPNLIVLQTLSKAWGAAGIRLGMAFASPKIISIMNKVKYPYNINLLTQERALQILLNTDKMKSQLRLILSERSRVEDILRETPYSYKVYPSDTNFLLVDVGNADVMYNALVKQGVVVRNRNNITLCRGCLRITIGTPEENDTLLNALKNAKS